MAKKSSSKKTLWQKFTTERGFIIFFIVLFIGSVAGLIYLNHQSAIDKDREQFMQAKSDLHALYGEIVAEVGQPTAHKSVQSCEYSSSGFATKGYLSCGVYEYIFIRSDSKAGSISKTNAISKVVAKDVSSFESSKVDPVADNQLLSESFWKEKQMKCGADYRYFDGDNEDYEIEVFDTTGKHGLVLTLYCTSSAKAEYFPIISQ